MLVLNPSRREALVGVLSRWEARDIIAMTQPAPKSISEIASALSVPTRTVYRLVGEMCRVGLLTAERLVVIEGGGRCALYRSMVRGVRFSYESKGGDFDVDIFPNESVLHKFISHWTSSG